MPQKCLKVRSKICKWFGHGSSLNLEGDEFSFCQSTRDLLTSNWLPNGVIDIFLLPHVRRLKDLTKGYLISSGINMINVFFDQLYFPYP